MVSEHFCTALDRVLEPAGDNRPWEIRRCTSCGHGWTHPPLAPDEIGAHYPPSYLGDTRRALEEFRSGLLTRTRSWRKETEKVKLVERVVARGRILDVGCGDGRFLWALDPGRWERTGAERDRATVELVRTAMPELRLVEGDLFSEALEEGAFDAVTFWHVLEHLPDTRRVLARARALARTGGHVIVSLPNFASLQARLFRSHWYGFDDVPRHLHHFSPQSLGRLIEDAGLKIEDRLFFSKIVSFHSLKHSLRNWSLDRSGTAAPYYALKPLLFAFPALELLSGRYGMMTLVARRP